MRKIFVFVLALTATIAVTAQDNIVKLGLDGLSSGKINLEYERVINDRQSANVRFGVYIPRHFPYDLEYQTGFRVQNDRISGFTFNPEYRFYGKKKDAPQGFYTGLGFNIGSYSIGADHNYEGAMTINKLKLGLVGVGVQFGYQWVINDMITIDWAFIGLRVNRFKVAGESYCEEEDIIDYVGVKEDIDEFIYDFSFLRNNIDIDADKDFLELEAKTFLPYPTMKLSVGFKF